VLLLSNNRNDVANAMHPRPVLQIDFAFHTLSKTVARAGWVILRGPASYKILESTLLEICNELGRPGVGRNGNAVETLTPMHQRQANCRSLSAKFGFGAFPLHTDGAHLPRPPRFVLLACVDAGLTPVPTTLVHLRDVDLTSDTRAALETAIFVVRNGRHCFYSSILCASRQFLRFDRECMRPSEPASSIAARAFSDAILRVEPQFINWHPGDIVVIDNWNVLHGRGIDDVHPSANRTLLRATVE